jgi:hypothetical protein
VEEGLDEHFAGELQKNYEYIPFVRSDFAAAAAETQRRLTADLIANHIPVRGAA